MRRGPLIALLAAAGAAVGISAELVSSSGLDRAAADLVTGWTLTACGLWGIRRRPGERRWVLLAAAGMSWFAWNFSASSALVYLHRGPLVHAAVAATEERSALAVAAVVAGYAGALIIGTPNGWLTAGIVVLLGTLVVRCGVWAPLRGARKKDARVLGALVGLAAGLTVAASTALADVSPGYASSALYAYEAALCVTALLLVAAASRQLRALGSITDLVVELGPAGRSQGVGHALTRALGDPTLTIGYWLADTGRYVDLDGDPVALPGRGSGRAATVVEHDGERIAALVHDVSLLDDPQLVMAVQEAAGLMLANGRLKAEAGARLVELRASRQRIVAARDAQRRQLARRLHDGAERRLADVAIAVERARAGSAPTPDQAELLDLIVGELEQARLELLELGRGIHPRILTDRGLAAALEGLTERAPMAVELTAPAHPLPDGIEAAAYFVCSEALTNVAKYARAASVRCAVARENGSLLVTVADDGVGGADPKLGSGLRGLADRVEALGGRLRVTSPPGSGTIIEAELPLDESQTRREAHAGHGLA